VQRLEPGDLALDAEASRYVARVHRLREGDSLVLFDPRTAREAEASIVEVSRTLVRCTVGDVLPSKLRALRSLTLLQCLGKGDKIDAVVRDATELGATRVVVVESLRSVVRLGDKRDERLRRWRRVADEAARQSGRGDAPSIEGPVAWSQAVRSTSEGAMKLCFWERATAPAAGELARLGPGEPLVVAAGPEGGLDETEIEVARAAGFAIVSLGPFILRTETVAAAVLGAVLLLGTP